MQNIMLAIHLIIALFLIVIVLVQRSEGGGLGIGGGGNAKPAVDGGLDPMQKLTWVLGGLFIASSIVLALMASMSNSGGVGSILDQLDGIDTKAVIEETAPSEEGGIIPESPDADGADTGTDAPALPAAPGSDAVPADPNSNN